MKERFLKETKANPTDHRCLCLSSWNTLGRQWFAGRCAVFHAEKTAVLLPCPGAFPWSLCVCGSSVGSPFAGMVSCTAVWGGDGCPGQHRVPSWNALCWDTLDLCLPANVHVLIVELGWGWGLSCCLRCQKDCACLPAAQGGAAGAVSWALLFRGAVFLSEAQLRAIFPPVCPSQLWRAGSRESNSEQN